MPTSPPSDIDRARVELAMRLISLTRLCEHLLKVVLDHEPPLGFVELIRAVRRAVLLGHTCVAWSVKLTKARGASWHEIGDGVTLGEEYARAEHEHRYEQWRAGQAVSDYPGLGPDVGMPADRWPSTYTGRVRAIAKWRRERTGRVLL
jgi:hypothetical protein